MDSPYNDINVKGGVTMKLLHQTRDAIQVELSPYEFELLRQGLSKELSSRRKTWKTVEPKFPEELLYHGIMYDTSQSMMHSINHGIKIYKEWGILK